MMTPIEQKLIEALTDSVNTLSQRVQKLEETINKGKGAYMAFITLLSVLGTAAGIWKFLGK